MTTLVSSSLEERAAPSVGSAIPWSTVLPLAVVMAYADGFWVISLRGAVGAIERSGAPFTTWLRESTLVLPVFVFAVLAALTLALRWFGPVLRRPKAVAAAVLLVVAAGTVAGVAGLVVSSAYDYHLQSVQLDMMDSMRGTCIGACQDHQQQATLDLQVRTVSLGSGIILASNLLVVGWVLALRGGRIKTSRRSTGRALRLPGPHGHAPDAGGRSRLSDVRVLLAAGLAAAGVIHAAVVPEHLAEWTAAGIFFVVLTAAELAAAALVLAFPRRLVAIGALILSVVPLTLWAYSRTLGMPFGPEPGELEPVGLADCAASALELLTLLASVVILRSRTWVRRPAAAAHTIRLALVGLVAVTAIGLGGTGLTWFNVLGGPGDQPMTHADE